MPHEFELIDQIVSGLGKAEGLMLGPGDDCALTDLAEGHWLASSIDSFLPDRHFPRGADAWLIAERCFRASLSDLAAMGAKPKFALVALALEEADHDWVQEFTQGIGAAARRFGCPVAGGNLAMGPMHVALSVHGEVRAAQALSRSGAGAGEDVYVSGVLGGAAKALHELNQALDRRAVEALAEKMPDHPLVRYWLPQPRLALGQGLADIASAAIDISDGLFADAWHIAKASEVGLHLRPHALPSIGEVGASDDYELLFTAPREARPRIASLSRSLSIAVTRIGETKRETGVWVAGQPHREFQSGFSHFSR